MVKETEGLINYSGQDLKMLCDGGVAIGGEGRKWNWRRGIARLLRMMRWDRHRRENLGTG
jgi:hypothetical protein